MPSSKKLFDYGDEALRVDVECYLEVTGATHTFVMRKALRLFLVKTLQENDGILREFEDLRTKRLSQGENVSVLPRKSAKDDQGKNAAGQVKETPSQGA